MVKEENEKFSYVNKIKFTDITGDNKTDKRVEYLWNLALSTIYENAKLSTKYVTLIKKITKNNLIFDNICCHYCNLIYIPFYNCEIKKVQNKNTLLYKCFLCNRKRRLNLQCFTNNAKSNSVKNIRKDRILSSSGNLKSFLINEIDDYEIKKKSDFVKGAESAFTEGEPLNELRANKDNSHGENKGEAIVNHLDDKRGNDKRSDDDDRGDNISDDNSRDGNEGMTIKDTLCHSMEGLFTIDYGPSSCTVATRNLNIPLKCSSYNKMCSHLEIYNNSKNKNDPCIGGNIKKKIKHNEDKNNVNCMNKKRSMYNENKRNVEHKIKSTGKTDSMNNCFSELSKKNERQSIVNFGNSNNFLNFNKSKKKKKNILDIL
ncbi:hypothetical protein MKS88_002734 [Plasmodium brasilianum]|uniref:Uncharacterized protein n=2 Tax=Plasmodium (Plasmodium) TaxID=418103 RepID=A0A1A8W2C1_PLAMA|nr:conserved Plasmodium protein, unknown function [Plasmodium malariae]KAI4838260.1 hypothetical protein MKS88_002734 [Plasmodium brasilianum]SBS85292.1 conserved Plasmodium protein, unknown function [Plasmodium malariae]SCN12657.1 conserved Plasmodium protein, unknown function [Plasmodium malariae]